MSSESLTPQERVLRARLAAQVRWAKQDPREGTKKARDAFLATFLRQVDPDLVLTEEERLRRARSLRRAHFTKMALASARSRRRTASRVASTGRHLRHDEGRPAGRPS
jgi:hypothetical protein